MMKINYCPILGTQVHFYQMPKLSKAQKRAYKKRNLIKNENQRNRRAIRSKDSQ